VPRNTSSSKLVWGFGVMNDLLHSSSTDKELISDKYSHVLQSVVLSCMVDGNRFVKY